MTNTRNNDMERFFDHASRFNWSNLWQLLDGDKADDELLVAVELADSRLADWPEELRRPPMPRHYNTGNADEHWFEETDKPRWRLVREFSPHGCMALLKSELPPQTMIYASPDTFPSATATKLEERFVFLRTPKTVCDYFPSAWSS